LPPGKSLTRLQRFLQPAAAQVDLDNAALLARPKEDAAALREEREITILAIGAVLGRMTLGAKRNPRVASCVHRVYCLPLALCCWVYALPGHFDGPRGPS
jgi:hypothetical protein